MSPRTLKWLHRIGYICTALIFAESLFIAYMLGASWLDRQRYVASVMRDTRTQDGAIPNEGHNGRRPNETRPGYPLDFANFASLPPLASLGGDGIRFSGHAALGLFGYALAIGGDGENVRGVLKTAVQFPEDTPMKVALKDFTMPRAAYNKLAATIDTLADGYPGDTNMCLDGLEIKFERVRHSGIISGSGNGACSDHYKKISAVMLAVVRQYAGLDVGENWMPKNLDAPH